MPPSRLAHRCGGRKYSAGSSVNRKAVLKSRYVIEGLVGPGTRCRLIADEADAMVRASGSLNVVRLHFPVSMTSARSIWSQMAPEFSPIGPGVGTAADAVPQEAAG